jgi:hypothetical protein
LSYRRSAPVLVLLIIVASLSVILTGKAEVGTKTYDFEDFVNNKAYEGTDATQPPTALEIGSEMSPEEYSAIASLDGRVAEFSSQALTVDYQRFRFKIVEPVDTISQVYAEHQGYGTTGTRELCAYGCVPGLRLFIWDYSTSSWEYLDRTMAGNTVARTRATIGKATSNYIDANGYLNLLVQTEVASGSCPFLYAFDGHQYGFVSDMYNRGIIAVVNFPTQPEDYAKIERDQLQPNGSLYMIRVAQEYDEISYLDQLRLITVDHSPTVDVFPSLLKADAAKIYTVSKNLTPPKSATDQDGKDALRQIVSKDGVYYHGTKDQLKVLNLNLGDLSGAKEVKLVLSGYTIWDNQKVENLERFVDVKDSDGNWTRVFENFRIITPSALPRTYVINMTGKFLSNDYSVRIGFYPDERIDYVAVDTSPQQQLELGSLLLVHADLHFRGYSELKGLPGLPDYHNSRADPPQGYSHPVGNFTRFGDVRPLLTDRDDKFVIMRHGDEISLDFQYSPISPEVERDFMLYSWGYYKGRNYNTGGTVDPLPFYRMSTYPYSSNERYPMDAEHASYLREYNTRMYEYEPSNPSFSGHNTIYTDYVKVDVTTGQLPSTVADETHAITGVVSASTTLFSTVTVTAMITVETPVIPLQYLSLFGFIAIICGLYIVRRLRKA